MDTTRRTHRACCLPRHGDEQDTTRRCRPRRQTRLRRAGVALVAVMTAGALTAPSCAAAMVRLPDPPSPWSPLTEISVMIRTLAEEYPNAPFTQRRRLHNDMVLMMNTPAWRI